MFNSTTSVLQNWIGLSVLFSSLFLAACDNSDTGAVNTASNGATEMLFSPPAVILQSRIDADVLVLEILVDGTSVPLSRNVAGQWVGTTIVPTNTNVEVIVNWTEKYEGGILPLATAAKELKIASDATSAELRFLNNEFNTSADNDGDGRSNLAERNDGTDPLDETSPGAPVNNVAVRIELELPASLSEAPDAAKQVITATAMLNGTIVQLTRIGDRWAADTFAAENSSAFVIATFYDSAQQGSRLAVVQRSQDVVDGAAIVFFADDYTATFDDDNDGLNNAAEITGGSNPRDSNSPARNPCDISQFTMGCGTDTDGDGVPDSQETADADSDQDGTPNYQESSQVDADGDGRSAQDDVNDNDACIPTPNVSACQATFDPTWVNAAIAVSGETATSLIVSWSGATHGVGVTNYVVTYEAGGVANTVNSAATTTTLTGLSANTAYTLKVEAQNATGNESTTGPSTTGTTIPALDTVAPTWAGGAVTVSAETETSMVVSWSGATDVVGVTGYRTTYTDGTSLATAVSVSPTRLLTGLQPATEYTITVEARDAANNVSTTGPTVVGSTEALVISTDTIAPTWPLDDLRVGAKSETSVTLRWSPAADAVGVTSYFITYAGVASTGSAVSPTTNITLSTLVADTSYTFTVQARDAAGNESIDGPTLVDTTDPIDPDPDIIAPTWPSGIATLVSVTGTTATVSWSGATDNIGVTDYSLDYDDGAGTTGSVVSTTNSATLTGLMPETEYTFTVSARDAARNVSGADSPTLTDTTSL